MQDIGRQNFAKEIHHSKQHKTEIVNNFIFLGKGFSISEC